jgi:ABC-2 type transport system ATP-binding protein
MAPWQSRRTTAASPPPSKGGAGILIEALRSLDAQGVGVLDVALRRPTLDDVFLTLTGHAAESDLAEGGEDSTGRSAKAAKAGKAGRTAKAGRSTKAGRSAKADRKETTK